VATAKSFSEVHPQKPKTVQPIDRRIRMKNTTGLRLALASFAAAFALVSASAVAAPPRADNRRPPQTQTKAPAPARAPASPARVQPPPPRAQPAPAPDFRFSDRDRGVVRSFYRERFNKGKCPNGLVRRNNSCAPSNLHRAWTRGQPLPPSVTYYRVPNRLYTQLPPPPSGYRYVRVASDILLLAIGTNLVVDALQDIFY
jgi:Ni/Co efflux regulator RcnB